MDNEFFNNIDGGIEDFDSKVSEIMNAAENLPDTIKEDDLPIDKPSEQETTRNQNFALENLKNVSKITDQAVRELFVLAKSTDSPRAWEVLAGMLKTQIDSAKTINDLSKKDTEIVNGNVTTNVTNNTTIIQSSEDVFSFLTDEDDEILELGDDNIIDAKVIENNDG